MGRLVWCECAWFEAVRVLGVNAESGFTNVSS